MLKTLGPLLRHDMRLQQRYGIYIAYGTVIAIYLALVWQFGNFLPDWAIATIIFTDPSVLGFFFLGALMMLEKAENTRTALAISPVSAASYFWSKTITLSAISLIAVILLGAALGGRVDHVTLTLASAITAVQFLALGVPTALYFRTVTSYLMGAAGIMVPVLLPAALAFYPSMSIWAMLWPPTAQFRLVLNASGASTNTLPETILLLASAVLGAAIAVIYAIRVLKKELGSK